ncbi:MAG: zinc-binding dehydrogenase [Deltaproteobacteria bacterium]|nr:zinc-binding dehydrogenase [Deltaproteobacteria bacterium]MBW2084854.1 zinc-binding dehydrogenase [Deltaproteobacteria bacterium]
MKAAVYYGVQDVKTEEVEKPVIGDNEILIKVKACGICGSDLHMYKLGLFADMLCRPLDKGGIPGHEFSGDVVEVGSQVQGIEIGDRVGTFSRGGMAEYTPVTVFPGLNVFKLPPEVSYEEAATLEPLANSLHAMLKANPASGENAVIFGAGIIGLGVIQCLKALEVGLNRLIMVDVSKHRLEFAKRLGADEVINAAEEDTVQKVTELIGSAPLMFYSAVTAPLVDIVYDCVGYIKERPEPPVIQQAMDLARDFTGRIVAHGIFEENVSLNLLPMVAKQINILGSFGLLPPEVEQALELMRTKKVDRQGLISHEFPLDQAGEAFEIQCQVEESVKVLLKP